MKFILQTFFTEIPERTAMATPVFLDDFIASG